MKHEKNTPVQFFGSGEVGLPKKAKTRIVRKENRGTQYTSLIWHIGRILEDSRKKAAYAVNSIIVQTYWEIGKNVVEYEQKGGERAEYRSRLLHTLSKDLQLEYGSGFGKSNLYNMRQFYLAYRNFQTVSGKLSWSHYVILLGLDDGLERQFYEKQCIAEGWSFRELKRQINSALFQRIALSRDKKGVLELAGRGNVILKAEDVVKDPYVLEFLDIKEQHTEGELEQKIIDRLQMFLLELGKGFAFVGRQHRISLGDRHFYVDLVFYHRILRCFVLIDLKTGEATHADVGQMNLYLNYFRRDENAPGDNPPVGIILSARRHVSVEYALGGIANRLFVSKYKLYLPDRKELTEQIRRVVENEK